MADSYVQVTPSTDPSAVKIDNESLTVGANTVYRQRVELSGAAAAAIASITNSAPSGTDYGLVVWAQGTVTVSDGGGSLTVDDGGGSLTVDGTVGVSGSVTVADGGSTISVDDGAGSLTVDGTVTVQDGGGTLSVDDGGSSLTVDGTVGITKSSTAAGSNTAGSATSVTLLSANASRLGGSVFNDSTAILYVKLGTTASATDYWAKLYPDGYAEFPAGYTGRVDGIWASATGAARVVELT